MIETMRAAPGVGLAAPQVNVAERVIVVELPVDEETGDPAELYALVNPEIVKASGEIEEGQEGCLSIPAIWVRSSAAWRLSCAGRTPMANRNALRPTITWPASFSTSLITWKG